MSELQRVLFLDLDYVVTSDEFYRHRFPGQTILQGSFQDHIDKRCVERLDQLVTAADCEIVLHSERRRLHSLDDLNLWLGKKGLARTIDDKTEELLSKEFEILAWLKKRAKPGMPEISYVIVDDVLIKRFKHRQVVPSRETGLSNENVLQALRLWGLEDKAGATP